MASYSAEKTKVLLFIKQRVELQIGVLSLVSPENILGPSFQLKVKLERLRYQVRNFFTKNGLLQIC